MSCDFILFNRQQKSFHARVREVRNNSAASRIASSAAARTAQRDSGFVVGMLQQAEEEGRIWREMPGKYCSGAKAPLILPALCGG
jgi:hypothetical protein